MTDSNDSIISIDIEDEMRTAYIDYAMSVIVSRALPDVRDGLKPVHRRVLFSMQDLGLTFGKPYKKSARIVGECFVAGTKVATPKGLISIEELKIGDEVFTQNAIRKVTQLYEMPKQDLLEVKTKNGMRNICTQGQMFKVFINESTTVWKKAIDLKLGDNLICSDISDDETSKRVDKKQLTFSQNEDVEILEQEIVVSLSEVVEIKNSKHAITYDIQVETDHEFIANGMLVHNCLGKYHPHGDSSVYDTMVRMAQPWSLRYPLVDGQGNFGSVDGDSAAAMRYCVTGNTRVKTDKGLVRIQTINKTMLNSEKDIQMNVLSLHKIKNQASKIFNSGYHPIFKLQTTEGFEIEGTANHPVLVFTKDDEGKPFYAWKLLEHIQKGDKIIIDRTQSVLNEKELTEEERNLALYFGEIGLLGEDIFTFSKAAQKLFLQSFFDNYSLISDKIELETQSHQLAKDVQLLLLEFGVIGKITTYKAKKEYKVAIGGFHNILKFSQNIGFATQKQQKLEEFLTNEQIRRNEEQPKYNLTSDYIPYIADYLKKYNTARSGIIAKKNIDRFERIDKYYPEILNAINLEHLKSLFQTLVADRYYFATVEGCEKQAEEQIVYSIKVESDCHSFVANGFINHNTEARLQRIAEEILIDINKDTIDFQPNFDDSLEEPSVLPCKIPHLLINGTSGIAVGMATNMPPHNISEVIDGIMAYLDDEEITIKELMKYVPAPDFPTGGSIYGYSGVRAAMETGRGRVVVRAKHVIEDTKTGKTQIIVTEIPYLVNKANLIERTWELVQEKKVEGISAIRDESDRDGMRIVYDLRRDAMPLVVLNQLFKYTSLQSSFSVNNVALVKGRPQLLNIKELMVYFIEHRHEVIYRRTAFELKEAKARQHILEGLLIALDNLDEVIKLIRGSKDVETARTGLIDQFGLSEIQARAILDMRLQRLTALERDKIVEEYKKITQLIARLEAILADKNLRADIIKEELADMKAKYGDARRTEIIYESDEFTDEDMIPEENMVLTISHNGYIKRTSLEEYRRQNRGGVGSRGTSKSEDYTEHFFVASTHDTLLIFTHTGLVFWLKAYQIPEVDKTARGRNIQNLLQMDKDEQIKAVINVRNLKDADFINNHYLVMCTEKGIIKKTLLEEFSRPRQNGIRAINFQENDSLLDVKMTNGNNEIIVAVRSGRAIRFNESKVRAMGRTATGVRGIDLDDENDKVVGLVAVSRENANLLVVSEKGYGKRSDIEDYRVTNRGGKGIKTLNITEKTGKLVAILEVIDSDDLMIINKSGLVIRMPVESLRVMGRATQGVRLIRLQEDDEIASITNILEVVGDESELTENESLENIPIADEIQIDENLNGHHENGVEKEDEE